MNIYQVAPDVFRFRIWNLVSPADVGLDGHYTIWWKPDGSWVIGFHGGYGGLTWFPVGSDEPGVPTTAQRAFLQPIIDQELQGAHFYDGCKINGKGEFLLASERQRKAAGEYMSKMGRFVFQADERTPEDQWAILLLSISKSVPCNVSVKGA